MGIGRAFGLGSSGGIFDRKVELVADLTSAFKTLNQELQKTRDLSAEISRNLKSARGGGGDLFDTSSRSSGTKDPIQNDGSQNGGNGGFNLRSILNGAAKLGGLAIQAMPTVQNAFAANLSASQAGFYSGQGLGAGESRLRGISTMGTFGSQEEVYKAQRLMNQYGMQGANNPVYQANIAAMSNLVPGSNSAAVGAVQALNQGRNVNMLRMIGVNVRGADGMMRDFKDIAKDLYETLKRSRGGRDFSRDDLSFSLQPGNRLASLMDQYFGNDPVLREGVINQLFLMAGGKGTAADPLNKAYMAKQGLSTDAVNSTSKKVASQVNATIAFSEDELKGYIQANSALTAINNKMADIIKQTDIWGKALQKIAQGKGLIDTLSTAGNNAGSGFMGTISQWGANLLGGFMGGKAGAGGIKNLFKGGGGAFLKKFLSGAGVYTGMEWLQSKLNDKYDLPEWANFGFDVVEGGLTGLAVGKNPVSAITGAVVNGAASLAHPYGKGGDDTSSGSNMDMSMSRPLAGNPQITSPFGTTRYLVFSNGQKSPSYGKPHGGVDYGVPEGTPVYAAKDGVPSSLYDADGFGNYVSLNQVDGKTSYYGHLSKISVPSGQKVRAGDLLGYSGNSGNSTGPHLHFEVRDGATKLDPLAYLAGASDVSSSDADSTANPVSGKLMVRAGAAGGLELFKGGEGDVSAAVNGTVNGKHSANGASINYGGVNVTMNFPAGNYNKEEIKQAVREALSYDSIRKAAVSS